MSVEPDPFGVTQYQPTARPPEISQATAVEQARAHVILAELEQGDGFFFVTQIGPRNQVLMHANRAIDFAATPKQIAQSEMSLDGVAVDFGELEKQLDRLVLLFIEQVVEAAEVIARQLADSRARSTLAASPSEYPARQRRHRQQQEQQRQQLIQHGVILVLANAVSRVASNRLRRSQTTGRRVMQASSTRLETQLWAG